MANIYVATDGNDSNLGDGPASGDAFLTWGQAASVATAGDTVYFVTRTAGVRFDDESGTVQLSTAGSRASGAIRWVGANSNGEVDGTMAVFNFSGVSLTSGEGAIHVDSDYHLFENISIGDSEDRGWSVDSSAVNDIVWVNCEARNSDDEGFYCIGGDIATWINCRATENGASGFRSATSGSQAYYGCVSSDNATHGFDCSADAGCYFCIASHNTSNGFESAERLINCNAYGNGGDGISKDGQTLFAIYINNISANNSGYGYDPLGSGSDHEPALLISNAFYNNALGNFNTADGYGELDSAHDHNTGTVILTDNPFVNPDINIFVLNNKEGGGQLCKGAGESFSYQMNTSNVMDIGTIQSRREVTAG